MAKKSIDPAFRTGTFLGESTHDPIAFVRRNKALKDKAVQDRKDEIDASTQEGLEKLMLDLKGWEDQDGFREIMDRQDKAMRLFTSLSKKGLNLTSPKSSQEIEAYRAINKYHSETKQIVDEWGRQKDAIDLITGAIKQEATKSEIDRRIDAEATRMNIEAAMKGKSISERKLNLENLLVFKPEEGDVYKFFDENKERIPKLDTSTVTYTDENGQQRTDTKTIYTPEKEREIITALGKLYDYAPERIKNGVKSARERNPQYKQMGEIPTDRDVFISMGYPQYAEKITSKPTGGGGGLSINFLGQKTNINPGERRNVPLPYGDRTYTNVYEFAGTKPVKVNYGAKGSSIFMGDSWMPLEGGGDVEAELRFYDPTRDEFVFRTTKAGIAPFIMNEMTFAVPRSVIGDQADDLPIMKDGKKTTLKDLYGTKPPVKKSSSVPQNFWSKPVYLPGKNR